MEHFSAAIPVLSIDLERQSAYMFSGNGERIEAGTPEFTEHLKGHSKMSVDVVSDWELEWYSIKRDHNGVWWAKSSEIRRKLVVGNDGQVTYDRLSEVEMEFRQLKDKNSKENV